MSRHNSNQRGFTIIELTLSMTFVAFILVFLALALVQMIRTYDKGLTIKQVNQAGRTITDEISKTISGELPGNINLANVSAGRLCIGNVMYAWNPIYRGSATAPAPNTADFDRYRFNDGSIVTMARQVLPNSAQCANLAVANTITRNQDNYALLGDRARVVWAGTERNGSEPLVKLTFVLGTYDTAERTAILGGQMNNIFNTPYYRNGAPTCRPGSEGNYCAFATFSTIVYLPNGQ